MNIYWCFEKHDYYGLFVIAKTSGQAKRMYADEVTEDFIDIRCHIYRKNVNEKAGVVDTDDNELLNKYNLEYADDEIPDNWAHECVL